MSWFWIFSGMLMVGVVAQVGLSRMSTVELKPGDTAPDFKLRGSDGKMYELAEVLKRQAVVLAWFPKAFTPGCTAECRSFRADGNRLREFDVAYFTASCDTPEKNREFAESLHADYPILSDPNGEVAEAYGVVKPSRRVTHRWTFIIGTDGKILAIDKDVNTSTHAIDVAKHLEELGVARKPQE